MQAIGYKSSSSETQRLTTVCYIALFIVASVASIAFAWGKTSVNEAVNADHYECVTVQPGDTLWALARERSGPEADLRRTVYEIRRVNGLEDARLRPGQQLLLPRVDKQSAS